MTNCQIMLLAAEPFQAAYAWPCPPDTQRLPPLSSRQHEISATYCASAPKMDAMQAVAAVLVQLITQQSHLKVMTVQQRVTQKLTC